MRTEPPLLAATRAVVRALVRGKLAVLARHQVHGAVVADAPPARREALGRLTRAVDGLRIAGDECDVDARALPVAWTMDLNWVVPPLRPPTFRCVMGCGEMVFQHEMIAHIDAGCEARVGIAVEADDSQDGVQMGGNQAVFCDVSAVEIDAENSELKAPEGQPLPARPGARYHGVDSGLNRRPELHELLQFMHRAADEAVGAGVPGAEGAASMLRAYDSHNDELWVRDKQHIYWLHRHVCAGKDLGRFDTPASLLLRACDAFAERPCLAVPALALVADAELPRRTSRDALPEAAGMRLAVRDGFLWLRFADLQQLVLRIAAGLLALAPQRSLVAIVGYNDFEWVVADFAIAVAGMASVGVHTTYDALGAAGVLALARPALLCSTLDMLGPAGGRAPRWDVATLLKENASCLESLCAVIATDCGVAAARAVLEPYMHAQLGLSSFLGLVAPGQWSPSATLPDAFEARGMEQQNADGERHDVSTLLFTSGSSGKPKAVAVGVANFVHDISGDSSERRSFSAAVTVSYIPLSHSSDRYKVWQHTIFGGRVGLCYYAAANWEAHEKDKKDAMLAYTSPIDGLFRQVRSLRPTNIACPPNIWAGLHQRWKTLRGAGTAEAAALAEIAALFGGRAQALATGGSPTSGDLLEFARALCRKAGAAFTESYGTTEAGAITCDGRQLGPKFENVELHLVDHPDLGFTNASEPWPCGEVAVRSPSLCVGYFGDADSERQAFIVVDPPSRPCPPWIHPALSPGRWYLTKDLGMLDSTGKLTLLDRIGAVVRVAGGQVLRLGELETAIEALPGVRLCLCHATAVRAGVAAVVLPWAGATAAATPAAARPVGALHAPLASKEQLHELGGASSTAWDAVVRLLAGAPLVVGIVQDEWTVASGLVSGELKKRRGELLRTYSGALEALHSTIDSH